MAERKTPERMTSALFALPTAAGLTESSHGAINAGDDNNDITVQWNYDKINGEAGDDKVRVIQTNKGTINCGDGADISLDPGEGCEQVVDEIPD